MKKKLIAAILMLVCLLSLAAAGALLCDDDLRLSVREHFQYPECPQNPEPGKWYSITPENARSADGSAWRGRIRVGDRDKLLIYFLGGGVVLDDFSASQTYSAAGSRAFYYDNDLGVSSSRIQSGIASDAPDNPFRDWSILLVPYTTGDFHVGNGGVHSGYANFAALLDAAMPHIAGPEQLLITGYSAGGFGAAMLAEEIAGRFPEAENTVLCIDSALLLNSNWSEILCGRWQAPEHISDCTQSGNLTLDHLLALNESRPDVKILFASSVRDGGLAKFQSYIDGGAYETTASGGEIYFRNLQDMVQGMQDKLPDAVFYLWDDAEKGRPTRHTMLYRDDFFAPLSDDMSMAQWILHALSGKMQSHGLDLLQSLQ